jgi:hypothetical protein
MCDRVWAPWWGLPRVGVTATVRSPDPAEATGWKGGGSV